MTAEDTSRSAGALAAGLIGPKVGRRGIAAGLIAFAILLTLVFGVTSFAAKPQMYSDSAWGFVTWQSMLRGAPFNFGTAPDPADISREIATFNSSWSPGQYLIPGVLERLGLSVGTAISLVTLACSLCGLLGLLALYSSFGFPLLTCAVTLFLVVLARSYALPFRIYTGGEAILFAVFPWCAWVLWRIRRSEGLYTAIAIVLVLTVAFFAKLSGLLLMGAVIAGSLVVPLSTREFRLAARRLIVSFAAITAFGLAFYWFWLSQGWTAASAGRSFRILELPAYFAFCIQSAVFSALSLNDMLSFAFLHPSRPLLPDLRILHFIVFWVALLVLWRWFVLLKKDRWDYVCFTLASGAIYVGLICLIFLRGGAIGADERFLRPVSLLFLVGIVQTTFFAQDRRIRAAAFAVAFVFSIYGAASYFGSLRGQFDLALGPGGFRHAIADQQLIDRLLAIDSQPAPEQRLIVVPSPEIALEVRRSRVLSNHADFQSIEWLRRLVYRGRLPELYVVVQKRLVGEGKADAILKGFSDYQPDEWISEEAGAFIIYHATS